MMSTSHIRICCCCATINRVRFLLQNCPCLHQRGATNTIFGIITTQSSTFLVLRQTLTKSNFRQFTIGRPTHWLNATLATNKNLKLHATQYWKKRPKSAVGGQPRLHHQHAVVPAQLLSE